MVVLRRFVLQDAGSGCDDSMQLRLPALERTTAGTVGSHGQFGVRTVDHVGIKLVVRASMDSPVFDTQQVRDRSSTPSSEMRRENSRI